MSAVWDEAHDALLDALERALGRAHGDRGHSVAAFRNAARTLHDAGVNAASLSLVFHDLGVEIARNNGPMTLVAHVNGSAPRDARFVVVNRWPSECSVCSSEIARGSLAWFRKPLGSTRGMVTCGDCESLDPISERAALARERALAKDDDPESLLAAILEHTPPHLRPAVEDALPTGLFMSEAS